MDQFFFYNPDILIFTQLALAAALGGFLGIERVIAGKWAGIRTYALMSLGSCFAIIISQSVISNLIAGQVDINPLQVFAAILTGVGFIGAGLVFQHESKVSGLTTAAGIWVASIIGVSVGYQLYTTAIFTTLLTLFIFTGLWFVEQRIREAARNIPHEDDRSAQ